MRQEFRKLFLIFPEQPLSQLFYTESLLTARGICQSWDSLSSPALLIAVRMVSEGLGLEASLNLAPGVSLVL